MVTQVRDDKGLPLGQQLSQWVATRDGRTRKQAPTMPEKLKIFNWESQVWFRSKGQADPKEPEGYGSKRPGGGAGRSVRAIAGNEVPTSD